VCKNVLQKITPITATFFYGILIRKSIRRYFICFKIILNIFKSKAMEIFIRCEISKITTVVEYYFKKKEVVYVVHTHDVNQQL
jgi:hypothetical protein